MASAPAMMDRISFKDRFCRVYQCLPEQFSNRVFWLCLYPQAKLFATTASSANPGAFAWDFDLIESVANAGSLNDIQAEIDLHHYHRPLTGPLKGLLRIRISGRRLRRLAREVFLASPTDAEAGQCQSGQPGFSEHGDEGCIPDQSPPVPDTHAEPAEGMP